MLIAHRRRVVAVLAVTLIVVQLFALGIGGRSFFGVGDARAESPAQPEFERTWARTDQPVAAGAVSRTWMWGPRANTGALLEIYVDAPSGKRIVQYFDKARMELNTDPSVADDSPWRVTNGLLVRELITGHIQVGDGLFMPFQPARIAAVGDPNDPNAPTYATLQPLLGASALGDGEAVLQRLGRDGTISADPSLAAFGVTAASHVRQDSIDHQVASVFWDFMNSTGTVWVDGQRVEDQLFVNPFYATGLPITEAYWTAVKVAGVSRDVLLQCFERRCLTYTPGNPAGWQVEAGNVGQHYFSWRSGFPGQTPVPAPTQPADPTQPPAPTNTPTSTSPANPSATATATSTRVVQPTATPTSPPPTATPTSPPQPTATATQGGGQSEAACLNSVEAEVLRLLNIERQNRGLAPFSNSRKLNTASYYHSLDMATNNFFSHTGSNGSTFSQRIRAAGYTGWTYAAENIAAGYSSASAVVDGWMNSDGHRRNILNASLTQIGIGLVQTSSGYKYYWTTDFGNASDAGC